MAWLGYDEKVVLLARTHRDWRLGTDSSPLAPLFRTCRSNGLTQQRVLAAARTLIDKDLLAPPATGGYIVTEAGRTIARRLRQEVHA